MFSYIWPVAIVVFSNVMYQLAAKAMPEKMHPLAAVVVTYIVGAVSCVVLYFLLNRDADLVREYSQINWAPFALGLAVVGLEVGMIYSYKAGWPVSLLSITQSTIVTICLIFVGFAVFKEPITWNKIAGIIVCMGGLTLINYK